jgi:hypothetical protein
MPAFEGPGGHTDHAVGKALVNHLTFERRLAGHVESGNDSVTDPALGT